MKLGPLSTQPAAHNGRYATNGVLSAWLVGVRVHTTNVCLFHARLIKERVVQTRAFHVCAIQGRKFKACAPWVRVPQIRAHQINFTDTC